MNSIVENEVKDLLFTFYSDEQIRKMSVAKIEYERPYESVGKNVPTKGGIYDPRLGLMSERQKERCETCGGTWNSCQAHFGHIELTQPVFNPVTFRTLVNILKITCWHCHSFLWGKNDVRYFEYFITFFSTDNLFSPNLKKREWLNLFNLLEEGKLKEAMEARALLNYEGNAPKTVLSSFSRAFLTFFSFAKRLYKDKGQ